MIRRWGMTARSGTPEQRANKVGRLDPATGLSKEYPMKPGSGPHGLVSDKDGKIWFSVYSAGYIVNLDPKTGFVTDYRLPDEKARDSHTPVKFSLL
ncbi:MAG: cytochrome [Rhodospirillales bacterium]|nr:cytochrome [Rhodospirillales bacterium]